MSDVLAARLAAIRAKKAGATDATQLPGIQVPKNELSQDMVVARTADTGPVSGQQLARLHATGSDSNSGAVSVTTDLQPTTLVVVERVLDSPSEASSDLESSDTGTRLDRSNPVHANFLQRLSDLEAALLIRDPLMRTHLGEIHKAMINYEEIPSLLTVDEISKIMAAQQVQTNTVLVASISKAAASKKAPKVTLDDI